MKITLTKKAILGAAAFATAGALSVSAMGMHGMSNLSADEIASRHTEMFQKQAALIGATSDEVKEAWAQGKDFVTLAKEKGVTEDQLKSKLKAERETQMKIQLQNLVAKGVITQAQADKRLALMQAKMDTTKDGKGKGKGKMMGMSGF